MRRQVCFTITALLMLVAASAARGDLVIRNASVIPMDTERVLEGQTLVIRDGVIVSLGDTATTPVPDDVPLVDASGLFVMPGLMDLHTHVLHEDDLVNYVAWGVTTVMHLGGTGLPGATLLDFREEVQKGERFGPNIFTTDRVFDGEPRLNDRSLELTTPEKARAEVRKLKERGFDFVKIYNNIDRPEFEAVVAEAQVQGLAVIGHIPRKFPALESLSSGHDAIAHTEELFFTHFGGPRSTDADMDRRYAPDMSRLQPLIDILLENDVAVMPDLCFTFTNQLMWDDLDLVWRDPEFAYLHPATASMWEQGNINRRQNIENFMLRGRKKYELMLELTRHFEDAGVLQVIGTDAALPGLYPGKAAHRELTELIKAGLSNYEALAIGTRRGGEFLQKYIDADVRVGKVETGFEADLVLLAENPLDDVRNTRKIAGVIVDGRYADRQSIDQRRAQIRDRYVDLRGVNARVDDALTSDDAKGVLAGLVRRYAEDKEVLSTIEQRVNASGYGAAFAGDMDRSLDVLRLNTALFPGSANTWDSLGEVTLYLGDRDGALRYYRKALEVDPDFASAAEQVQKLERGE